VIYDWRMNDKALALSSRMPKAGQAARAPSESAPRKQVVCETGGASKRVEAAPPQ
jgi:soluble lytic murein transglycosylase